MQSSRATEPPDHADPPGTTSRARGPFAKLLSVLRGDKYMADAYEPAWSAAIERRAGAAVALPGATPPKER
jgi:hypothetical protein